jgi:hypothetical protein
MPISQSWPFALASMVGHSSPDVSLGPIPADPHPVIADKPFARSAEEADKVIKLAEEKGLIVTCFQNRRWVSSPTR